MFIKASALRSIELHFHPVRFQAHFVEAKPEVQWLATPKSLPLERPANKTATVEVPAEFASSQSIDNSIESRSMSAVMEYEAQNGRSTTDVSALFVGYDIQSVSKTEIRLIEVKGKSKTGPVTLTANEWRNAKYFGAFYFLYIVESLNSDAPSLKIIQDPAAHCAVEVQRSQFIVQPNQYLPFAETIPVNW